MTPQSFWETILKAVRAATFLVTHAALALLFIVIIYGIQRFIAYLWGTHDPLLLDVMPLRYFFDAIDIGVLIMFGVRGMMAAWRAFED